MTTVSDVLENLIDSNEAPVIVDPASISTEPVTSKPNVGGGAGFKSLSLRPSPSTSRGVPTSAMRYVDLETSSEDDDDDDDDDDETDDDEDDDSDDVSWAELEAKPWVNFMIS